MGLENKMITVPIASIMGAVIICGILLGTTVYLYAQNTKLNTDVVYLRTTASQFRDEAKNCTDYYVPYKNVVDIAKECVKDENCSNIIITPIRNQTNINNAQPQKNEA